MERNDNHLNNTLSIFAMLNFKEEVKTTELSENNILNIKKIWNLALEPNNNQKELIHILADKDLSDIFYKILKNTSLFYFPKVKAAASNYVERISKDFEITSFSSKKNDQSIYIKLKFFVKIDKKIKYLYVGKNKNFLSKELPQMINNEIQFILDVNEKFFISLQDPDSEIFIR